jgi:hypothetical protein
LDMSGLSGPAPPLSLFALTGANILSIRVLGAGSLGA